MDKEVQQFISDLCSAISYTPSERQYEKLASIVEHMLKSRPTPLEADWSTVAVCPDCKVDYDVEQTMCISCGRPTAKA